MFNVTLAAKVHSFSTFRVPLVSVWSSRHLLCVTGIYGSDHMAPMAQTFHCVVSCGKVISSFQTPGVKQSRHICTHAVKSPALSWGPSAVRGVSLPEWTKDESRKRGAERIYGMVMMPSNISGRFQPIFTEHVPWPKAEAGYQEKDEQDIEKIGAICPLQEGTLCLMHLCNPGLLHRVQHRAVSKFKA